MQKKKQCRINNQPHLRGGIIKSKLIMSLTKTMEHYQETHKKLGNLIMPFGKYKGKQLKSLPLSYCGWLLENCHKFIQQKHPEVLMYLEIQEDYYRESYWVSIPDMGLLQEYLGE